MSSSRKGASRLARTIRSLVVIVAIGASLAVLNVVTTSRDVATATGAVGAGQRAFFVAAAERPDLELFFKALSNEQRVQMARRLGEYDDPAVAQVIAKLLGTFDPDARAALQDSLVKIALKKPQAAVDQLTVSGSFQQLAISKAVQAVGAPAIPLVAEKLRAADARTNAVALLVDLGPAVVPNILPMLDDKELDVRLAAADVLGKLREPSAVPKLSSLYDASEGDEKLAYLSAIASIGDPQSERLLKSALNDESLSIPTRSQAALGLGRVETSTAATALEPYVFNADQTFAESALSGLILAGDQGIASRAKGLNLDTRVRIAGGLRTEAAKRLIEQVLLSEPTITAADAAANWDEMAPTLSRATKLTQDGEVLDHLTRSLATTEPGRAELQKLRDDPTVGGYAFRRLKIGAG